MALGETVIHTSPSHHYVRLRSLLPTRLSSFPTVSSLPFRVSCVSLYSFAIIISVGAGPIAGNIYCSDLFFVAHLFMLWFHFVSCVIPSVFYLEDILFV